jgi:hypothetical protein
MAVRRMAALRSEISDFKAFGTVGLGTAGSVARSGKMYLRVLGIVFGAVDEFVWLYWGRWSFLWKWSGSILNDIWRCRSG